MIFFFFLQLSRDQTPASSGPHLPPLVGPSQRVPDGVTVDSSFCREPRREPRVRNIHGWTWRQRSSDHLSPWREVDWRLVPSSTHSTNVWLKGKNLCRGWDLGVQRPTLPPFLQFVSRLWWTYPVFANILLPVHCRVFCGWKERIKLEDSATVRQRDCRISGWSCRRPGILSRSSVRSWRRCCSSPAPPWWRRLCMKPSAGRPSGSPRCCQTGSGTGSSVAAGLPGPGQKKPQTSQWHRWHGRTDRRMGELINAFVFSSQNALCSTSLPVFACCSIVGLH